MLLGGVLKGAAGRHPVVWRLRGAQGPRLVPTVGGSPWPSPSGRPGQRYPPGAAPAARRGGVELAAPAAWSESVSALRVVRFAAMLASARRDDDESISRRLTGVLRYELNQLGIPRNSSGFADFYLVCARCFHAHPEEDVRQAAENSRGSRGSRFEFYEHGLGLLVRVRHDTGRRTERLARDRRGEREIWQAEVGPWGYPGNPHGYEGGQRPEWDRWRQEDRRGPPREMWLSDEAPSDYWRGSFAADRGEVQAEKSTADLRAAAEAIAAVDGCAQKHRLDQASIDLFVHAWQVAPQESRALVGQLTASL